MQGIKFDFNSFTKKINVPWLYIGDANQRIKHTIPNNQVYDLKMNLYLNNISEMTFKIYKYYYDIDGTQHELPAYDYFNGNFVTIHTEGYGEWSLYCYDESSEGSNPNKSITAKSLEIEFCNTKIYGYGNVDDDEDLPLYRLVNYDDKGHSALHVALAPLKHWSIGYVSPNISTTAHTIEWDENNSYDFLCTTVAESFSCFFVFDTVNKRVNAYKANDVQVAKDTNIYLSFNNLLKSVGLKWNMSEIKTVLEVIGGSNSDGTSFGISDINLGNNRISNFDFVYQFWSDGLKSAWDRYKADETRNKPLYEQYSTQLENLYIELESLNSKETTETDYTNMGYAQLCIQRDAKLAVISSYNGLENTNSISQQQYSNAVVAYNSILSAIEIRTTQIKSMESAIDVCIQNITDIILDFEDYCTEEQYIEFLRYNRVDTYQNDDYCTYDSTTVSEFYTLARELKTQAEEELISVCYPRFELSIDCINFTQIEAFKNYTDVLDLGDLIHIDYSYKNNGDNHLYARILEVNLDFNNPENIGFTLSNKDSLDEQFRLKEIQSQTQSNSTSLNYNYSGLKSATVTSSKLSDYMASDRDLMNQRITSDSEEIIINNSCLLARCKTEGGNYLPTQLMLGHGGITLTDSNWEAGHTKIGIGLIHLPNGEKMYGFSGEVVYGNLLLGSQLEISNDSANLLFNNDGMAITNSTHSVKINPNNPTSIIEISSGTDKIFYIDATTKKLTMTGEIKGSKISGSSFYSISNNGVYDMELNYGNIYFNYYSGGTNSLTVNYLNIGWTLADGTIATLIEPTKIRTSTLELDTINLVNSSKLYFNSSNTEFSGDVKASTLYSGSSEVLTKSNYSSTLGSVYAPKTHSHSEYATSSALSDLASRVSALENA